MNAGETGDPLGIIGKVVLEKYRILSLAGEGGFSAVYKAEHLIWRQPVAMKFFVILEEADPKLRERLLDDFVQEGKLMSELSSRSTAIVQARDIGKLDEADGRWIPFMVLEWLEGTPLDVVLQRELREGLPARALDDAMALLEPVAQALDVAHRRNIAHRDLKPANVMVMGDAREPGVSVKVLDFGIAKVMAEHTELQSALQLTGQQITSFTPQYGAPEQFSRNYGATGPWTDVFALALILSEMLRGGERALAGDTFFELGVSSCDPSRRPTPSTLGALLSAEVEGVFAKALSVSPADRYSTMGDFWAALHAAAHPSAPTWRGAASTTPLHPRVPTSVPAREAAERAPTTPVGASFTGAPPPVGKPARRRVWLAVGGLALAAAGGAVAASQLTGKSPAAPTSETASAPTAGPAASVSSTPSAVEYDGPCPKDAAAVAGGSFRMGSDDPEFQLWSPAHKVTLDSFCLDKHEVTGEKYEACVTAGVCAPASTRPDYPKDEEQSQEAFDKEISVQSALCNADKPDRQDHPINCLDWARAERFCEWRGGRLPTEAEWEYAARGTKGWKFPWGDDPGGATYMNAGGPEWERWLVEHGLERPPNLMYDKDDGYAGTAPVGRFPRGQTQSGQFDMVGNVWEWTADLFETYKPDDLVNPRGAPVGDRRVIRGGGFNGAFALWVNPAFRYSQFQTASAPGIGFRCAADVRKPG